MNSRDFPRTWALLNEAFSFIKEGPRSNLQRARALILRAQCHLLGGELEAAQTDLSASWSLIEPHADTFFAAGWPGTLGRWREIKAQLFAHQHDLSGAVSCWHEIVERRRIISCLPQLAGPYKHSGYAAALNKLGKALREVGDDVAAKECFEESDSLRRSIGLAPLER